MLLNMHININKHEHSMGDVNTHMVGFTYNCHSLERYTKFVCKYYTSIPNLIKVVLKY